jgi:beta-fructofuranosidase
MRIRAWRDNSVLEIFVNERTAISTRLYAAEETVGIRFFADDGAATSSVESASAASSHLLGATLWDGIAA